MANVTSINIAFTTTSSAVFSTAPSYKQSLGDSSNRQFLRTVMLTTDGVKIISQRSGSVVQIPLAQLFAVADAADPTLTWAPIITTQPVSQSVTHPLGVNYTVTASAETAISYQWQAQPSGSSSFYNLPIPLQTNWTGSLTPHLTVSQSWYPNTISLDTWQFRAVCSNTSGQTTSSAVPLNVF